MQEVMGEDGGQFVCDRTFGDWVARFIRTEGCPLFPGHDYAEDDQVTRV